MPIEINCPGCDKRLRVGDEHAGKKTRCPSCGMVHRLPRNEPAASAESSRLGGSIHDTDYDPSAETRWRLQTPDGEIYGPASQQELLEWITEGRVTVDCRLQRDEQDPNDGRQWRLAGEMFPTLREPRLEPAHPQPRARRDYSTSSGSPYRSSGTGASGRYRRPHRSGVVLTYGVLAMIFFPCPVFSILAWVMGYYDLSEMDAGRMNPSGRSLTQVGMGLGIGMAVIQALGLIILTLMD